MGLGAGRQTVEDNIDYAAGMVFHRKCGDKVAKVSSVSVSKQSRLSGGLGGRLSISPRNPQIIDSSLIRAIRFLPCTLSTSTSLVPRWAAPKLRSASMALHLHRQQHASS